MVNSKPKSLPTSRNKSSHNLSIKAKSTNDAKKLIDMNELILQLNELKSLQKLIKQNKPRYIKT
jgi:hypothetical protein